MFYSSDVSGAKPEPAGAEYNIPDDKNLKETLKSARRTFAINDSIVELDEQSAT